MNKPFDRDLAADSMLCNSSRFIGLQLDTTVALPGISSFTFTVLLEIYNI